MRRRPQRRYRIKPRAVFCGDRNTMHEVKRSVEPSSPALPHRLLHKGLPRSKGLAAARVFAVVGRLRSDCKAHSLNSDL